MAMDPSLLVGREAVGSNLESVLMDQKMRADKHRVNFDALKSQHIVLQEAHAKLQVDHEVLGEELNQLQSRSENIIATLQKERDLAIAECEEQRAQVPSEEAQERLRSQLLTEVEGPFRRFIQDLEKELDEFKSDYNKLRYNYSFLKSEFESSRAQHQAVLEEEAAKHKAELSKLLTEKRDLVARSQRDLPAEIKKLRQLQRENAELQQKVDLVTSELQESREKMSELNTEQQQSLKDLQRQLAEATAQAGLLEREREAAEGRGQRLEAECSAVKEELQRTAREVERGEEALTVRDRKLDSQAHTHRVELSELKISHAQQCSHLVREKEQCVRELEEVRSKMEVLQRTIEQQQARLAVKDQEAESRVAEAHEEEWSRTAAVQQEKGELEDRIAHLEREKGEKMAALSAEVQSCEERLRVVSGEKLALESELTSVKKQCSQQRDKMAELEQEVLSLRASQRESSKVAAKVASLEQAELDLAGDKERLQVALGACQQEVGACQQELEQVRADHSQLMSQLRASHKEERTRLQQELEAGQRAQRSLEEELAACQLDNKKKVKHYRRKAQDLQHAVEKATAEHNTTKLEKEHLSNSLGLENQKVKRKLHTLQQRHERLLAMMNHAPPAHPAGVAVPQFAAFRDGCGEDMMYEREAAELSERVDRMNDIYHQLGGALLPDTPAGLEATGSTCSLTNKD